MKMLLCRHESPGPSLDTGLYRSSLPPGLTGYILYRQRAVIYRFLLVVSPLLVHVKESKGVYRLWVRFYFSSSNPHICFVLDSFRDEW